MNNYHVLFVHFPIALLSAYALFEMVRLKCVTEKPFWFYIKATFAILGTLASYVAIFLGGLIEDAIGAESPKMRTLIDIHSTCAGITAGIFSLLGGAYLVAWIDAEYPTLKERGDAMGKIFAFLVRIKHVILLAPVAITLSILGLLAITTTGAMGGAMVYGQDVDPIVHFVYGLLVK